MIFGSHDDLDEGWARARVLEAELREQRTRVRLIDKLGFDLDNLKVVAHHRIVTTPMFIVLSDDRVVARHLGLQSARSIVALLDSLGSARP